MKKALLLIVLTLACASVSGQEKKDPQIVADLQENIFRAGVNTNPYEYLPIAETPVPKGFKPFYISHYGRHGSRSDWSRDNYPPLLEQFTAAHDAGLLTQEGETAFERIKEVIANHNGNDGALTRLGTQEHRQIAGRMYDKYGKTVFNKKGPRKVRAISSTVQRCIVSMSAFTGELISRDPGLDIWWNTGESYMPVCSTSDPDDVRAEARKILRAQSEAHVPDTAARNGVIRMNDEKATQEKEVKRRFQSWLRPSTIALIDRLYEDDNCKSRSEFIEKSIRFYAGYLSTQNAREYLPNIVVSTLKSIVAESDNRQNRMLFKLAVEIAIMQNLVALQQDIDPLSLERLRGDCVKEVKRLNGSFSFEDALEWQKD